MQEDIANQRRPRFPVNAAVRGHLTHPPAEQHAHHQTKHDLLRERKLIPFARRDRFGGGRHNNVQGIYDYLLPWRVKLMPRPDLARKGTAA